MVKQNRGDKMRKAVIGFIFGALLTLSIGVYAVPEVLSARFTEDKFLYNGQEYDMRIAAVHSADEQWPSTYIKVSDMARALGGKAYSTGTHIVIESGPEFVAKACKDSCVMIYAYQNDLPYQGSGWVYKGYIITAEHVIRNADRIEVFPDDSVYGAYATVEYADPDIDFAVLKLDRDFGLPSVTLGDSDKLVEGQKLVAITSPAGVKNVIDECLYSGMVFTDAGELMGISEENMIGGSSGGAIFNIDGELVAMNIRGNEGSNFAIPINDLKPILQKLIK